LVVDLGCGEDGLLLGYGCRDAKSDTGSLK